MRPMLRRTALAFGLAAPIAVGARRGGEAAVAQDEARAFFERFVAAQNAHDAAAVEGLLSTSPSFLWITRGAAVWGREAAMARFRALYKGTWRLQPDMQQFRAIMLGDGVIQIFAPVLFTIGGPGQPARPSRFLMNQILVHEGSGWRVASLLPIPAPQQS